ncbi:hypothetical protein ACUN0G_23640 [Pseudomonas sp. 32A]|uniref:hypothetical protein n=1 Tax=Pseudomonas sp. 32A TaxID=651185 RepID=UPI0040467F40
MATAYINQRLIDYDSLKRRILNGASPIAQSKFDALNVHLPGPFVRPGYMVIVPGNTLNESTADEAWLMSQAEAISRVLDRDPEAGEAVVNDYDLLQSVLGYSSLGIGSATSTWSTHLNEVTRTLDEIEQAYGRLKQGTVDREEFFKQREVLLKKLNVQLHGAARFGTGLRSHGSLRRILGISTRSFLHKREIKGYAQRIERITAISRHLRKGTYIGLMLDVSAAGLQVKEACASGREDECRKAQFVEGGKLVLGTSGAALLGAAGAKVAGAACKVVLGVALKGTGALTCAVLGGAAGGYTGGTVAGGYGAELGELLYVGKEPWT